MPSKFNVPENYPKSPDVEDRRKGILYEDKKRGPSLGEGYRNLSQTVLDVKGIAEDAAEYVKNKFTKDPGPPKDIWEAAPKRAERDLGGPRTPPYKGGK